MPQIGNRYAAKPSSIATMIKVFAFLLATVILLRTAGILPIDINALILRTCT